MAGRITQEGLNFSAAKMVKRGDLIIALYGATAGVVAVTDINAAINQAVLAITTDQCDKEYLFQHLASRKVHIVATYAQGGQPNLSGEIIRSLFVSLPSPGEQRAIAVALSDVDGLIWALEKLIVKKRVIKQAAMQRLLTGKTRLPGFDKTGGYKATKLGLIPNDWRVQVLQKGIVLLSGHHVLAQHCNVKGEGVPYLTGPADFPNGTIKQTKFTVRPTTLCEPNDILVTVKGSGTGTLVEADAVYCISRQLMAIRVRDWSARFIFFSLLQNASKLKAASTGLIPGLSRSDILGQELPLPADIEEQKAIATVISDMDAEIAAFEQRRDKTKQIKLGMMQQLLTGRVRLVKAPEADATA